MYFPCQPSRAILIMAGQYSATPRYSFNRCNEHCHYVKIDSFARSLPQYRGSYAKQEKCWSNFDTLRIFAEHTPRRFWTLAAHESLSRFECIHFNNNTHALHSFTLGSYIYISIGLSPSILHIDVDSWSWYIYCTASKYVAVRAYVFSFPFMSFIFCLQMTPLLQAVYQI